MKKIFLSVLAVAALASCTKMDTAYEAPQEIGFVAVGSNITKAPVNGNVYPIGLNMYVNAYVHSTTAPESPDYISNGEFKYKTAISETTTTDGTTTTTSTNVWGGWNSTTNEANPYYWPNEKTLHFSGYSKSGSFTSAEYNPSDDELIITGYNPGLGTAEGANDLMWFPSTIHTQPNGYGKTTKYVPVNMYHTCSWITFMVQGDITTGDENSSYKITSLTMNDVDMTANVTCTGDASLAQATIPTYVVWTSNTDQTEAYNVGVNGTGVELKETYTSETSKSPRNIETGLTTTVGGNIVVIPQKPGTINLTWTYKSSTNSDVNDSATGLSLKLNDGNTLNWEPGKHYIYTITIKANEILIAPKPVDWIDGGGNGNVTVE